MVGFPVYQFILKRSCLYLTPQQVKEFSQHLVNTLSAQVLLTTTYLDTSSMAWQERTLWHYERFGYILAIRWPYARHLQCRHRVRSDSQFEWAVSFGARRMAFKSATWLTFLSSHSHPFSGTPCCNPLTCFCSANFFFLEKSPDAYTIIGCTKLLSKPYTPWSAISRSAKFYLSTRGWAKTDRPTSQNP